MNGHAMPDQHLNLNPEDRTNLDTLQEYAPLEMWHHILSFGEIRDLLTLALVCKDLQSWSKDQSLWKPIYQKTFNTNLLFEKQPEDYRVAFIERNRNDALAAFEKLSTGLNSAAVTSPEFSLAEHVKNVFVALKANQFGPRHALELIYAAHFMFDKTPNQIFIDDCNENPLLKKILQANPFCTTSDMEKARMLGVLAKFLGQLSQKTESTKKFIEMIEEQVNEYCRQDYHEDRVAYD